LLLRNLLNSEHAGSELNKIYMIIRKEQVNKIDFDGLGILDYTSGCNESSSFATIKVPQNISHKVSWSKRSDKYYYVFEGEIKFTVDAMTTILKQGDFCIIKKGSKFCYHNESGKDVILMLVHTPNFDLNEEVFE
jgi:mannose-6-phosphate isomerase-like protein (cupin superfamily)